MVPPSKFGFDANAPEKAWFAHAERVVLFIDIVESVRLIEADQDAIVLRWLDIVEAVRTELLNETSGRIVKETGDGLLLEFQSATEASATAFAIQRLCETRDAALPPDQQIRLRFGISLGDVIQGPEDIYGHEVNVAARLMSLAEAGEIVVSAAIRDRLTADVDADIEDMGECFLRHLSKPVRAFRLRPPGMGPAPASRSVYERLRPSIAVLPLDPRSADQQARMVGEALADELIQSLSRSAVFDVISRLSSRAFGGRAMTPEDILERLGADYLVSGSFALESSVFRMHLELCDARSGRVIWASPYRLSAAELQTDRGACLDEVVVGISAAVTAEEVRSVRSRPLATLRAHTLLTAAVNLMRRLSSRDFHRARDVLEALLDRSPREPLALSRMAEWRLMRAQQGWSEDLERDGWLAAAAVAHALDEDPSCSVSLMVDGAVQAHFFKRLDVAERRYNEAIEIDQSNGMAWLRRGTLCAFTDRGERAVKETSRALALSPHDPSRFLYDSLAASAHLTAGDNDTALAFAERSLRLNRLHTSTLRVKAVAQWRLGQEDAARESVVELLRLEPEFTITRYLNRVPSANYHIGRSVADALSKAGVPT